MISMDVSRVIGNSIGNAKVNQLQLPFDNDKICWLEIRMYNLFVVDDSNGLQHLRNFGKFRAPPRKKVTCLLPVIRNPDDIQRFA